MYIFAGIDWVNFLPAVQTFLHGGNPYLAGEVFEPFWTYIFLAPFAMLPFWIGRGLLFIVSLFVFMVTALKMEANRWQLVMFLLSYPVIGCLYEGNIDWLVTAGFWMPPQIGLFFVLMKPQIGIGIALFWGYIIFRRDGWKKVVETFAPVISMYMLSFLIYGFWIFRLDNMQNNGGNMHLFPYLLPLGLTILFIGFYHRFTRLTIIASPLVAPYASAYNFSGFLLATIGSNKLFILSWVAFWIPPVLKLIIR